MLNSSNYFLLISLAILSWILLCLSNSKPSYEKFIREQERPKKISGLIKWSQAILHSVSSVNSGIMIYIACTLLGIFIIANIIKRKLNALNLAEPLATIEAKVSSLKHQVSRLRTEKCGLLNLLRQYKLEKKFLIQHVTFNSSIIQKLKSELKGAKEQLDVFRCKLYMLSNSKPTEQCYDIVPSGKSPKSKTETSCISSAYIINHYFRCQENSTYTKNIDDCDTFQLTASNHDIINSILKEAYEKNDSVSRPPQIKLAKDITPQDSNKENMVCSKPNLAVANRKFESEKRQSLKEICNVNIVSTDQLEVLKGLSVKSNIKLSNVQRALTT